MKSRLLRFVCLFLFSILLVTACNGTQNVTSKPEPPPLQVVYSMWPGYFPMAIAKEKGFFAAQGAKVEPIYVEEYLATISEFSTGKYDAIALTIGGVINILGKNPHVQVVFATDESAGGDALIVRHDIKNVADLKGKRIGTKLGDFGELFVTALLEKQGLTTDDVTLVNIQGEKVPDRLISGDIQAGHTWEPYIAQAVKSGNKVLFTSMQTPGLIPSVILFRTDTIRDRPKDVQAFIRAWFQAKDYWKKNPQESKVAIAKALNIKPEEVSSDGIKLYGLQDNLNAFTPGSTNKSLYHTAKLYADFYIRTGGISAAPDIQNLINTSFVQQLQSSS